MDSQSEQHTGLSIDSLSTHAPLAGIPTFPIEFGDVITPFVRLYKYTVQHSTTVCMCISTLVSLTVWLSTLKETTLIQEGQSLKLAVGAKAVSVTEKSLLWFMLSVYGYESILVRFGSLELLVWSASLSPSSAPCLCWNVCVSMCFSAWVCVFHVGHPVGTKRAVCAPSGCWNVHFGQQAASVLNRSCPSYCTSRTMSFSLSLSESFSLYDHIQTVFLMRDWRNRILIGCVDPDVPVAASLYLVVSQNISITH